MDELSCQKKWLNSMVESMFNYGLWQIYIYITNQFSWGESKPSHHWASCDQWLFHRVDHPFHSPPLILRLETDRFKHPMVLFEITTIYGVYIGKHQGCLKDQGCQKLKKMVFLCVSMCFYVSNIPNLLDKNCQNTSPTLVKKPRRGRDLERLEGRLMKSSKEARELAHKEPQRHSFLGGRHEFHKKFYQVLF